MRTSIEQAEQRKKVVVATPWRRRVSRLAAQGNGAIAPQRESERALVDALGQFVGAVLALAVAVHEAADDIAGQQGELEQLFHHSDDAVSVGRASCGRRRRTS